MPAPAPVLRTISRTATGLGLGAGLPALIVLGAAVALPYFAIPDGVSARIWLQFTGTVTAATALGAAGGVLSTRSCVRPGYLDLWYARSAGRSLLGTCVVSTASAVGFFVLLVSIVSGPPAELEPEVIFGGACWLYAAAVLAAVALTYTCFAVVRPRLWRTPYVQAYRGHKIAAWEKRR